MSSERWVSKLWPSRGKKLHTLFSSSPGLHGRSLRIFYTIQRRHADVNAAINMAILQFIVECQTRCSTVDTTVEIGPR